MRKEILLFRSRGVACVNCRSPTASLAEGESHIHISKLECQDNDCDGLDCNHGCFKSVNPMRRKELDDSEMLLPQLEPFTPINFVCKECIEVIEISRKISTMKSSAITILNDLAVNDVIAREKSIRKKVLLTLKGAHRKVQVYKYMYK